MPQHDELAHLTTFSLSNLVRVIGLSERIPPNRYAEIKRPVPKQHSVPLRENRAPRSVVEAMFLVP